MDNKIQTTTFNQPIVYNVTEEGLSMLENKWSSVPDCSDKTGYALVRGGISELKGLRTSVEKRRKELKAESLDYGRRVDNTAKEITARIEPLETKLKAAKQAIDDKKARQKAEKDRIEKERVDTIRAKMSAITALGQLEYGITLEEMQKRALELTSIDYSKGYDEYSAEAHNECGRVFKVLDDAIAAETKRIEEEAARKAEQDLIAEEQRIERERLEAERAEIEAARIEQENAARAERERIEAEQAAKQAVIDLQREVERKADEDRRKDEQRKLDAERAELAAQQKKIDEENERQRLEAEAKAVQIAETESMEEKVSELNCELVDAAAKNEWDIDADTLYDMASAIVADQIPHVKYTG